MRLYSDAVCVRHVSSHKLLTCFTTCGRGLGSHPRSMFLSGLATASQAIHATPRYTLAAARLEMLFTDNIGRPPARSIQSTGFVFEVHYQPSSKRLPAIPGPILAKRRKPLPLLHKPTNPQRSV
jgi:hypothetical protein